MSEPPSPTPPPPPPAPLPAPPQPQPQLPPAKEVSEKQTQASLDKEPQVAQLTAMFATPRHPAPVYFRSVDCVGVPGFLTWDECSRIIEFAEAQGFSDRRRGDVLRLQCTDIVDVRFAEALWHFCGLEGFLDNVMVDDMVPCGLNDCIRIHKYVAGSLFGRHTDQHIKRADGRISKYSLRVFLNSRKDMPFEGGLSAFHVPSQLEPVVFEPETGMALLYPQGEQCTMQEETRTISGHKYVLRADVLFTRPDALNSSS